MASKFLFNMDKAASNFLLPSPNFSKAVKEQCKTNFHYLTPCGMTLLPRAKQPPPMYGARGSTVPAKFLQDEQQQQNVCDTPPIYIQPAQPEYCANCVMQLATSQDMKRHLEQHEACPADDCDFDALANILERHMEENHITGLYKTVKKAWTPEEIAAWRADRRKKYPTTANIEQAKRAKEQRLKRGERLEASKARFGKPEDRRRARPQNQKERLPTRKRKKPTVQNRTKKNPKPTLEKQTALDVVNIISSTGVPMFEGTAEMTDYKHFKSKATVGVNALSVLGIYGSESEPDEESEDEKTAPVLLDTASGTVPDGGLVAQSSILHVSEDTVSLQVAPKEDSTDAALSQPLFRDIQLNCAEEENSMDMAHSSDEAPDEVPIERRTETPTPVSAGNSTTTDVKVQPNGKLLAKSAAKRKKCIYGLNYKRARLLSKQNTMLEKLLAPDIRHERNLLLQCVRYVCEQNFFSIGAKTTAQDSNV